MTHILTLISTQGTFRLTFPPSMPTQFFIQTVCTRSKLKQKSTHIFHVFLKFYALTKTFIHI